MSTEGRQTANLLPAESLREDWIAVLDRGAPIAGLAGPGRWLVLEYEPTALFSLKASLATSSVGKTLLVPTPYAVKMALVDGAFRAGLAEADCATFLRSLVGVRLRLAPPSHAVVTHTFVKIRQESRNRDPLQPYIGNIAYRELVHYQGVWKWALDLAAGDEVLVERAVLVAPHVNYVGKRGSFIQFKGAYRLADLGAEFTESLSQGREFHLPWRAHIAPLDDFGPEADFETLSSFSTKRAERGRHRCFVDTLIPLGIVNSGPGFTEYSAS